MSFFVGRSDWIRISDLYVPNVAFYQAELHSVIDEYLFNTFFLYCNKNLQFVQKKCESFYTFTFSACYSAKFIERKNPGFQFYSAVL